MKAGIAAALINGLVSVGKGMFGDKPTKRENATGTITAALVAGLVGVGVPDRVAEGVADGVVCAAGEVVEYHAEQENGDTEGE